MSVLLGISLRGSLAARPRASSVSRNQTVSGEAQIERILSYARRLCLRACCLVCLQRCSVSVLARTLGPSISPRYASTRQNETVCPGADTIHSSPALV